MAVIGVIEFSNVLVMPGSTPAVVPVGVFNQNTVFQSQLTISTSAVSTSAFGANTRLIRVVSTAPINFAFSTAATTGSSGFLPANTPEYFACAPGQFFSAISSS